MKKYTNEEGINLNTFKLLFENKTDSTIDMQISKGIFEVDYFTFYKHNIISDFIHQFLINPILYPHIHKVKNGKYKYKSNEEEFDFILLNKYFKQLFLEDKYIQKQLIYNYKNACRASTCQYSIILSCYLPNSYLIIGNVPLKNGENILHRFVLIEKNGIEYILDIAKNIIMKKDQYYEITHFEELGRIKSEDLRIIYNFAEENRFCNHTGIISMFGEEIINELNKNNMIKTRNNKIPNFRNLI